MTNLGFGRGSPWCDSQPLAARALDVPSPALQVPPDPCREREGFEEGNLCMCNVLCRFEAVLCPGRQHHSGKLRQYLHYVCGQR